MDKDNETHDIDIRTRLNAVLNTAIYAVICINSRGIIDLINTAAEKMFGYSADEIIGKNINLLMPEPYANEHDKYLEHYEKTGEKKIIGIGREIIARHKNGESFPIELEVNETRINGQPIYTGFIRDLRRKARSELQAEQFQNYLKRIVEARTQELTEANKKLEELVRVDGLTNIANRRHFDEVLVNEIRRASRNNSPITLILCDIDEFKQYNDHYGHVRGDQCLQNVAACLHEVFKRSTDLPARYGGEEFAIILPETNLEEAEIVARNMSQQIDKLHIQHAHSTTSDHVTLSAGVACARPTRGFTSRELIEAADKALYAAKRQGRNRIETVNCNS